MDNYRQISFEDVISNNDIEEEEESTKDILDILLDQDNRAPIVLVDEKGRRIAFEQVAIIPHEKNSKRYLYAVLKPITKIKGISDDEAIVFYVDEVETDNPVLKVETDEKVAIEVFDEYYKMLDEAHSRKDENKEIANFIRQLNKKHKGGKK
nr:hypothetical protein [Bacteroides intestinalis]